MDDPKLTSAAAPEAPTLAASSSRSAQPLVKAQQTGADALDHAGRIVADAKDRGAALAGDAKAQALSMVDEQKASAASHLSGLAEALHKVGAQSTGDSAWIGNLLNRGGDEIAGLAETVRDRDMTSLVKQAEGFARRQPALFIGASLIAGFALVRFGKVAASGASTADLPPMPEVHHDQR